MMDGDDMARIVEAVRTIRNEVPAWVYAVLVAEVGQACDARSRAGEFSWKKFIRDCSMEGV